MKSSLSGTVRVRELVPDEFGRWDAFVASSPQGTLFSESWWLRSLGMPFRIYAYLDESDREIMSGVACCEDQRQSATLALPPLSPFQGFLYAPPVSPSRPHRELSELQRADALIEFLERRYERIALSHHFTLHDLRPFYFRAYGRASGYAVRVRYTHVVRTRPYDPGTFRAAVRQEIRKALKVGIKVSPSESWDTFLALHRATFERQGLRPDISEEILQRVCRELVGMRRASLFSAQDERGAMVAGALMAWDAKRAYYLMGAGDPGRRETGAGTLVVAEAIRAMSERFPEVDLVGANSPKRGYFKSGFGGVLRHYFVTETERDFVSG